MSGLRPTTIAPFTLVDITWRCFTRDGGNYVWRSQCGRFAAWREGAIFYASRDGRRGTIEHKRLVDAMLAAQAERRAVA